MKIKNWNDGAAFEPDVSLDEIVAFEEADKAASSPAARLKTRCDFAKKVLARTAPVTADMTKGRGPLNPQVLNRAALDIYQWPFTIALEEDVVPLG